MSLRLTPFQMPDQRMRTVTLDEVLKLGERLREGRPLLDHYFSPTRREQFIDDYIKFLDSSLFEAKQGNMDTDLYLLFVLSFQFVAPLLDIPAEKELVQFYRILEKKYSVEELDINLHFATEEYEPGTASEEEVKKTIIKETEAVQSFRLVLDESYTGRREVKESVEKRLKQDGIKAIMEWQRSSDLPSLAEAFGRCIVIPAFFEYIDKKLLDFYRRTTEGIQYQVAVPEFE